MSARRSVADSTALAIALVLLFGVIYAVLARVAFDNFPFSGDEYSLKLQADLFAKGLLKTPAPPHIEWLRVDHVIIDEFVRSKYPPGAPLLVSLGARFGVPWLITPLEGMVTVAVVWLTARAALGPRPALVALVAIGAAPLFIFDAASYYMHAPALMCLAIAFAAVARWTRSDIDRGAGAWPYLVVTGVMLGCTFLIRPIDALMFGAAMIVFRSPRAVIITAVSALPFVVINLWYQSKMFGGPFTDGYHAYEPTFTALYGPESAANPISFAHAISPVQWWNRIDVCGQMCLQWTVPGTVIAALFGIYAINRDSPARGVRNFALALIVVVLGVLVFTIAQTDDGPHPRYLSVTLIPLALLAAAGFAPLSQAIAAKFGTRLRNLIVTLAVVFGLAQFASFIQDRVPKMWLREGLYDVTRELPTNAIVMVRAQYPSRFARNGPFFTGVLYLSVPPETTPEKVAAAYPDRPIWEAHEGVPWTLVRVR